MSIFNIVVESTDNAHLHSENAKARFLPWCIHSRRNSQSEYHSGIGRIDHAIIPQTRRAVVRIPFLSVLAEYRLHELLLFVIGHGLTLSFQLIHLHLKQNIGGLLAAHNRNSGIGPHPELSRSIGSAAHTVVSCAV